MEVGSFARRSRRVFVNRGVVALAAAAGILATRSAMAQVVDPAPTANAGGPYSVAAGATVQLSGTFTGAPPITLLWTVSSGSLSDPTIANFVQRVARLAGHRELHLTTGSGSATSSTTITIASVPPPVTCLIRPITILSGAPGIIHVCSGDPIVPITFTATQSGVPALLNLTVTSTGPSTADVSFTAPTLPLGRVTPDVIQLFITPTNAANATCADV
jgi:hypothetical protein